MPRYKLTIEYDGTDYAGWQRQDDAPSVQQAIETAIYKFAQESVTLHCAGRTDAGVHALGQCAHFDMEKDRDTYSVREGLNVYLLPQPVAIVSAEKVGEDFHARFSAKERSYVYRIVNRPSRLALDANRAWQIHGELDTDAMHQAAQRLLGTHDFTSFRASECQAKSPVKTLDQLDVVRDGEEVRVHARAQSFLHHMVRNLVGSLAMIGQGKWTAENLINAMEAKDRRAAGPTAPAQGLYFVGVKY